MLRSCLFHFFYKLKFSFHNIDVFCHYFDALFFQGTATARFPAFCTCRTSTLLRHIASLSSSFLMQAITRLIPFTSWCFASMPSSRKKPTVLQRLANWGTWWINSCCFGVMLPPSTLGKLQKLQQGASHTCFKTVPTDCQTKAIPLRIEIKITDQSQRSSLLIGCLFHLAVMG